MTKPSQHSDLTHRWIIVGLLFFSTFLNYFDRQTLSILKPVIKGEFGLDDNGYANVVSAFMITYVFAYALAGRFVDRVGSRVALAMFVGLWSLANLCTGFTQTVVQLVACRAVLGLAEPGNYPAALRTATRWFPANLRGTATGIYQAGSATAAVCAVPIVAFVATQWGWRTAFILPGLLGLFWALTWWFYYREPTYLPAIPPPASGESWISLFHDKRVWGIVLARLVSDQAWYFCLFWMPGYLQENLHLSLAVVGLIGWLPFLFADLGGVGSGLISDRLVKRGWAPAAARRRILLLTACLVPVVAMVPFVNHPGIVIAIFSLLAVVCQIWLFNITTLVADTFPTHRVGSVLGIAGSFGALGGLISTQLIGLSVSALGFTPIFVALGFIHLVAAAILSRFTRG